MSIRIHQALYGERERGHGLIATNPGAPTAVVRQLEGLTDLPASPPSSIPWEPYLSGFPLDEWYVVSRTGPDPGAARGGMVLTHVLLVPGPDVGDLEDLQALFGLIPQRPTRQLDLTPVDFSAGSSQSGGAIRTPPAPPGLAKLVHELLASSTVGTVGWVGEEGFAPAIGALWTNLWPEARRNFRFRLSFRPSDLGLEPPPVVLIPAAAEHWWHGWPLVRSTDAYTPSRPAEAFLLGDPEGDSLRQLIREVEGRLGPLRDLDLLERAFVRLERLGEASVDEVRALARLLGKLSPEAERGVDLKRQVLSRLEELTRNGNASAIRALENFDSGPFSQTMDVLSPVIRDWVGAAVRSTHSSLEMGSLMERAFSVPVNGWSDAITGTVAAEVAAWKPDYARMLWEWWTSYPQIIPRTGCLLPQRSDVEVDLERACPARLPEEAGTLVRGLAQKRDWWRVHAAATAASLSPQAAIDAHLAVDRDFKTDWGVRVLAGRLPAREVLQAALRTSDPRLIAAAGAACAEMPNLRAGLDVSRPRWRDIWLASIRDDKDPWSGISDPSATMSRLLDLASERGEVSPLLLEALASTSQGDLTEYPSRADLWANLESPARSALLEATAEGWLQRFGREPRMNDLEPPLRSAILEHRRLERHLRSGAFRRVRVGVALFEGLGIGEDLFDSWLEDLLRTGTPLTRPDAEELGAFISRRRWAAAAERAAYAVRRHGRNDLIPAVTLVRDLLDLFTRLHLGWQGVWNHDHRSADDWWRALVDVTAELYSFGPTERNIWERAGGDAADLDRNGDGRQQWRAAIGKLRSGGGGKITGDSLVTEMRADFPRNEKLQALQHVGGTRG